MRGPLLRQREGWGQCVGPFPARHGFAFIFLYRGEGFFVFPRLVSLKTNVCVSERPVVKKNQFVPALLALIAAPASWAAAQSQPQLAAGPVRLPKVVVTATRTQIAADRTASSVSVIDRETIQVRKFRTIAEALESLPGVAVIRNGTPGQVTSVFTRGSNSKHTLLTIDGRRAPNMLAGGFDWGSLTLDGVERIEMVRSSSGSLYGGDAIGGVVNIITESGRGLKKPEFKAGFEGGSFQSFRETASVRGAQGKLDYAVAGSHYNAEFPRSNNDYRRSSVRGSLGYEINPDTYVDVKASYYQADGGSPGSTAFPSLADHLRREVVRVSPGIEMNVSEDFTTRAYYTYEDQTQPSQDFGDNNRLTVVSHMFDWQADHRINEELSATAGVLFQAQDVNRTTTSAFGGAINAGLASLAGYGQVQWDPVDNVTVLGSVRQEHYSDFADATSWRAGVSAKVPQTDTTVFGSVARSVSTPTAQDLYFEFPAFNSFGNLDLRSERAISYEVGVSQPVAKDVTVGLTYFRHDFKDLIQFIDPDGFGPQPGRPQNINDAFSEGVETSVDLKVGERFDVNASYTYLTAVNERTGRRLIRRPRHQTGVNAAFRPHQYLTFTGGFQWVLGRQDTGNNTPIGDYFLLQLGANLQATDDLELWIRGENLTDDKFEYTAGFPALRLGIYGGFGLTF